MDGHPPLLLGGRGGQHTLLLSWEIISSAQSPLSYRFGRSALVLARVAKRLCLMLQDTRSICLWPGDHQTHGIALPHQDALPRGQLRLRRVQCLSTDSSPLRLFVTGSITMPIICQMNPGLKGTCLRYEARLCNGSSGIQFINPDCIAEHRCMQHSSLCLLSPFLL